MAYVLDRQSDPDADARRIHVVLHHRVLPKLAGVGLVAYDPRGETIRYREDPLVETLLADLPE